MCVRNLPGKLNGRVGTPFVMCARMKTTRVFAFVILLLSFTSMSAFAQDARETSIVFGGGVMDYDLSGTGKAPVFGARVTRDLGANFVFEGGFAFAKPEQQFGPSTLWAPEALLQYQFPVGRFRPYLGAGIGAIRESGDAIETDWTPTVVFAGGSRVNLNDRVGLFGELRIRGIDWDFVGTTADITGGLVIRLGR